jgi:hypothetical protein
MSTHHVQVNHPQDHVTAISAVAVVSTTSARGPFSGIHVRIDVDRVFLVMKRTGDADWQQSLGDSCTKQTP